MPSDSMRARAERLIAVLHAMEDTPWEDRIAEELQAVHEEARRAALEEAGVRTAQAEAIVEQYHAKGNAAPCACCICQRRRGERDAQ